MMTLKTGQLASRFPDFKVVRPLGSGGMAEVWLVENRSTGKRHALKVLRVTSGLVRSRMLQEGRLQAGLHHPNLVGVQDVVWLDVGIPALVMDYVDGASLDVLMASYRFTLDQADHFARGLMGAIAAAHSTQMIHRDLKPENILIDLVGDQATAKVADFGLAKLMNADAPEHTRTGLALGTPRHMAPEQFRDAKHVDHRADVFSLGTILYEMVTGHRAFDDADFIALYTRTSTADYEPVEGWVPNVPERMRAAIHGALKPNIDDRIQSVEELLEIWNGGTEAPEHAFSAKAMAELRGIATDAKDSPKNPESVPTMAWDEPTPTNFVVCRSESGDPSMWAAPPRRRVWAPVAGLLLLLASGLTLTMAL